MTAQQSILIGMGTSGMTQTGRSAPGHRTWTRAAAPAAQNTPTRGGPDGPPGSRGVLELLPELDRDGARLRGDDVRLIVVIWIGLNEARELCAPVGHVGHDQLER